MQAGAYQNGTWVVGVAKGGAEEGVPSLADRMIAGAVGQGGARGRGRGRRAASCTAATSMPWRELQRRRPTTSLASAVHRQPDQGIGRSSNAKGALRDPA